MDKNQEISIQTQQKFEFYYLALVFTVLGLSIQTSVFTSEKQATIEIIAWISLLISGLAGLSRMEWVPISYKHASKLTEERSIVADANTGRPFTESGRLMSEIEVKEFIQRIEKRIKERTAIMDEIDTRSKVKYFLHKWMFVVSLVLLVTSRSINLWN